MKKATKKFMSLLMAAAVTLTAVPVIPAAAKADTPGLIAEFDFESGTETGAIADVTGNAKAEIKGIASESGTASYSESYNNTKAAAFNSDFWLDVTKEDGTPLLGGLEEITISFDSASSSTGSNIGWLFYAATDTTPPGYWTLERYLGILDLTDKIIVERYNGSGGRPNKSPQAVVENAWKHVDLVITETESLVYVDGQLTDSAVSPIRLSDIVSTDGGIVQIGKANWEDGEYYNGLLDNLRIYDGALTEKEIEKQYDDLWSEKIEGLIAEFDFESAVVTGSIADTTGNAKAEIKGITSDAGTAAYGESYNETRAASFNSDFWLNVTKEDGTPLLKGLEEITVSFDSASASSGSNTGWLFYAATDTTPPGYWTLERYLGIMDLTNKILVERYNGSGGRPNKSPEAAGENEWKHVDLVITETESLLYVDGVLADSATSPIKLSDIVSADGGIIQIGKANWEKGEYYNGLLDNLRIYESALTDDEITKQYNELWDKDDTDPVDVPDPFVHYDMSSEGDTLKDVAEKGYDAELIDFDQAAVNEYDGANTLTLNGAGYIALPDDEDVYDMLTGQEFTISTTVSTTVANDQWLWAFGKNSRNYSYFTPSTGSSATKYAISYGTGGSGGWSNEQGTTTASPALDGSYATYTVVVNGTSTRLYIDGILKGIATTSHTFSNILPTDGSPLGYIGYSFYTGDPIFEGSLADFRIYDEALDAGQVREIGKISAEDLAGYIKADAGSQMLNGNAGYDYVSTDVSFPSSINGVDVSWSSSNTDIIDENGAVALVLGEEEVTVTVIFTVGGTEYSATYNLLVTAPDMLIAEYDMTYDAENNKLKDITGNGLDAETVNITKDNFTVKGVQSILHLNGDDEQYAKLPEGIVYKDAFTIEAKYATTTQAAQWLWCLGTKEHYWPNTTDYVFVNPMQANGSVLAGIKKGADDEQRFTTVSGLDAEAYHLITMVAEDGDLHLYIDGEFQETISHGYSIQELVEDGATDGVIGYIGKSLFLDEEGNEWVNADDYFTGELLNFKVYNYALSEDEIEYITDEEGLEAAVAEMDDFTIPNSDAVMGNITLTEKTQNGGTVIWTTDRADIVETATQIPAADNYVKADDLVPAGVVTRPADEDKQVTLTATVHYGTVTYTQNYTYDIVVKQEAEELEEEDFQAYLLVHFTGETSKGEQIYFATSEDAVTWTDLNNGNLILESDLGEKGLRDPYIIRSPEGDKFYLIATDLRIASGNGWTAAQEAGSQSIMIWESTDLVNWSDQRMVKVAVDDAGCTWAPEAYYDEVTGEYIVFWASKVGSDNFSKQRVYYAKTRDFYTFTEPEVYIEKSNHVIDTTIIQNGDFYYRYSKDESTKRILSEKVSTLLHSPVEEINSSYLSRLEGVEGPEIFKLNSKDTNGTDTWMMMLDRYSSGSGYLPVTTTDLDSGDWTVVNGYNLGKNLKRHGSFLNLTKDEYYGLLETYGGDMYDNAIKKDLEAALAAAADYDAADYTAVSYAALTAAIADAEAALASGTAADMKAALTALQTAVKELVPVSTEGPDNYVLNYFLALAKGLNTDNMLASAAAELDAAITFAESLTADASEEDIIKAVVKLVLAIAKSDWEFGDTALLEALVILAEEALTEKPDHEAAADVAAALEDAYKILSNPKDYFDHEIEAVYDVLYEAYERLTAEPGDLLNWTDLEILIASVTMLLEYTDEAMFKTGWDELMVAYEAAMDLRDADGVTQEMIDDAAEELQKALGEIRFYPNKNYLASVIAQAEKILSGDLSGYTEESVAALRAAVTTAIVWYENDELDSSNDEEIETIADAVADAIKDLTKKDIEEKPGKEKPGTTDPADSDNDDDSDGNVVSGQKGFNKSDGGNSGKTAGSAKTGDNSYMMLYALLLMAAGGAFLYIRKRRSQV